jgi:hypothetical protein
MSLAVPFMKVVTQLAVIFGVSGLVKSGSLLASAVRDRCVLPSVMKLLGQKLITTA